MAYRHTTASVSRLGKSLEALRFLLKKGARWTPDDRAIADARRSLYRVDAEAITTVIDLLRTHDACDDAVLKTLVRTPKMRGILAAAERQRKTTQRDSESTASRTSRDQHQTTARSFFHSRYDRERLYNEVWTEPTQKVAQRYGVSDVAIA